MTSKKRKKKFERKSEKLWKELARKRAGNKCELCQNPHVQLNVHHIVNKSRCRLLRWDLQNALVLCPKHHTMGDISAHSLDYLGQQKFHEWLDEYLGEKRLEYLQDRRYKIQRINLDFAEQEYEKLVDTGVDMTL